MHTKKDLALQVNSTWSVPLFVLNPFISLCYCLYTIANKKDYSRRDYRGLFFVISLFMGVLAFTQKTNQGDIIRIYERAVSDSYMIEYIALEFGSSLFRLINVLVYKLTGNVQYISVLWVTLIYYLTFLSVLNIYEHGNHLYPRIIYGYVIAILLCFVVYTQVTEIMKQGVAASLFFYGFTSLINGRKINSILSIAISLGIHGSSFFFLPLFLAVFLNNKRVLLLLALLSFGFRQFNLMSFVAATLAGFDSLSSLISLAEMYSDVNMVNFFRADTFYFTIVFFFYFFYVLYVYARSQNNSVFLNACLLMVVVLNLNYEISHNFTRMLTMMFPFYTMLYSELRSKTDSMTSLLTKGFLFTSFVLSFVLMYGRLVPSTGYLTSYMDNSLVKILLSPLYFYLTTTTFEG